MKTLKMLKIVGSPTKVYWEREKRERMEWEKMRWGEILVPKEYSANNPIVTLKAGGKTIREKSGDFKVEVSKIAMFSTNIEIPNLKSPGCNAGTFPDSLPP